MLGIVWQTLFHENKIKNHKMYSSFVTPGFPPLGANKSGFKFHFNIRGKLSIILCDK